MVQAISSTKTCLATAPSCYMLGRMQMTLLLMSQRVARAGAGSLAHCSYVHCLRAD